MPEKRALDGLPISRRSSYSALVWIAVLEALSLTVLLVNLATGDNQHVAQGVGPLHGALYLAGIALTCRSSRVKRVRLLAFVPVVGAFLAVRVLR